ncbi:MAG: peroxiredoxin family protein [Fidelibacterota bacterium]
MKNRIVILVNIVILLAFCTQVAGQRKTGPAGTVGSTAADFSLINLNGEEVTLEQYRGKVILLNFWASWCAPCKIEIPDFIRMYEKHREDGLEIIGITLSSGSVAEIRQFVQAWNINYPILTGDEKYLQDLTLKYDGIRGVPTTFLIDREGKIRQKWIGARTEKIFMAEVENYL